MNATSLGILLLGAILLQVFIYANRSYSTLKFRARIFTLRQKLKRMTDSKHVAQDDAEMFDYLLFTINRDAHKISLLSLYITYWQRGKKKASDEESPAWLHQGRLGEIQGDLVDIILIFVKNQNIITYVTIVRPFIFCWKLIGLSKKRITELVAAFIDSIGQINNDHKGKPVLVA